MFLLISLLCFVKQLNTSFLSGVNFYHITGLERSSEIVDIKKSYRKFINQRKKEINPSQEEISSYKQVELAYNILANPHSKALYDLFGIDFLNITTFKVVGYHSEESIEAVRKMMGHVPSDMENFGGMAYYPVQFDLIDFVKGATKRLTIIHTIECECPLGGKKCSKCLQNPYVDEAIEYEVVLPAGASEYYRIVGRGIGDSFQGRGVSDFVFVAYSSPHPMFQRDGKDLRTDVFLKLADAIQSNSIYINGIDGEKISLSIQNAQHLMEIKIPDKGLPDFIYPSTRGSIIATFHIESPQTISPENLKILDEILVDQDDFYL